MKWNTEKKSENEMFRIIEKGGSDFEADIKAEYSNSNCVLLSYILQKAYKELETDMSIPIGAGAIVFTTIDLTQFADSLFNGQIINSKSLELMETLKDKYGYGLFQIPFGDKKSFKVENKLVGLCGYKGQPNEKGQVEIGYKLKVEYRNNGLATELAKSLIENAFDFETVHSIQAHTLGQINASTKVLLNCGFQKIHEMDGKELGTLWKWELKQIIT